MKSLSIRTKITLLCAIALVMVVTVTYFVILFVSDQVFQKSVRDSLIEAVEQNITEIKFSAADAETQFDYDNNDYIEYNGGYLQIDDAFLDELNQVYTSLYSTDGSFLYGENPIALNSAELSFLNSQLQNIKVDGTVYYVFDRELSEQGLEGLWIRGIVSEEKGRPQFLNIARISLIALPLIVLFALISAYILSGKMLRPIQQMVKAASQINKGGDLNKRIELKAGSDELHRLADSFNHMLERLQKSFENERRFTSDASHELRTPISVILAQCEYTLEKERSIKEYQEDLQVILRQSKKMSALINDMLDFTRLESKAQNMAFTKIDLSKLVSSLCEDMALLKDKNISLSFHVQNNVFCSGNHELLSRLLTNLISNAYRYGKTDGHIWVDLAKNDSDNTAVLSVGDDGIGIAAEDLDKIFLRFYQAEQSHSGSGTGLGLAMVYEIAQLHSGSVSVKSELGKGSNFIVTLPLI